MKKITVLFTVIMMLAASSAWAVDAVFPGALNGSNAQFFTGFQVNASSTKTTLKAHNMTFNPWNSSKLAALTLKVAAAGKSDGNTTLSNGGNIGVLNSTTGTYLTLGQWNTTASADNSSQIKVNNTYNSMSGLTMIGQVNGTGTSTKFGAQFDTPFYMVGTGSYQLMAGLNNATFNGSRVMQAADAANNGANFALLYNSSSFAGVYSTSDVWDMYGVGYDYNDNMGYYIIGQVKLTAAPISDNNVQAKYVAYGYDGATLDRSTQWYNYNATTGNSNTKLTIARPDSLTLVENATINSDKNFFSGYTAESTYSHFVVFVKNGQTISTNDVKNRGYKLAYAGYGTTAKYLNNATAGLMSFQANSNLALTGDMTEYSGGKDFKAVTASIDDYSIAVANTNYFKSLTQSNMTITSSDGSTVTGAFYGKQDATKTFAAGIYKNTRGGSESDFNLVLMFPNSAQVGALTSSGSGYQSNSTMVASYVFATNNTAYSDAELKARWTGLPSNFVALTGAIGFNSTAPGMGAQRGDIYYTFQVPFSGIGNKISTLNLYKIFPNSDKTVRSFSYAAAPTTTTDGAWWISTAVGDGYLNNQSYLVPATTYYLNYVLKDNGNYDYRGQAREFGDPVVLGTTPESSSSSSSGCVFNPAAGFGLEWLLLMAAPLVAVLRSRFKK